MAKPIQMIRKVELTEEEKRLQSLEGLLSEVAQNKDSLLDTLYLLRELHNSGILEILNSLVQAKEEVVKIAVGQMTREPITNIINNAMAVGGALTALEPEMTKRIMGSVAKGLEKAEQGLQSNSKVGILDLLKVLNDPYINRAIGFGLNLLKGIGEGLKE
ncbi:DUF1641 domain-containing protein [Neobacillus cucumis]|uniref:DUF1641 domain-containing protein n=1 Tax=Neobacillus cucumis TaxID=1740721 RepID=UPI002E2251AD|nr:DUF1641 domain-containing protein [Neobacillus cucumis]